jgi:hypothetical protein
MRFRNTIILALILLFMGGYILYDRREKERVTAPEPPDVWSLDPDAISRIHIRLLKEKKEISFLKNERDEWIINNEDQPPVSLKRWGGIVLLLSGPQAKRLISEKEADTTRYGVSTPRMVVSLTADKPGAVTILVGDPTPDEKSFYTMLKPFQAVYLLDRTWYDTIERLVLDPPEEKVRSILSEK